MRGRGATVHQPLPHVVGAGVRCAAVLLLTTAIAVGLRVPTASANEHPAFPSQEQVDEARERVTETARSVEAIRADLAAGQAELDRLGEQAAAAFAAYQSAVADLQESRRLAAEAQERAERYARRVDEQRQGIAGLVADTYQGGGSLGQVSAYLLSDNPDRLMNRMSAYKGASDSLSSRFDALAAEEAVAQVYRDEAESALREAEAAAAEAEEIRLAAQNAVAAQQSAIASMAQQRDALLQELAQAQNISVALATQRQEALERIEAERRAREERRRAEEEARRLAEEAAQRQAELAADREARETAEAERRQDAERRAEAQHDQERPAAAAEPAPQPEPDAPRPRPRPEPRPAPAPAPPRPTSSVVLPLAPTAYYFNQDNFGNCGSYWSNCHTGTDFSTSCGTPVLASNSGTVNIRTDQAWSGIWLVQIYGYGGTVTWYAHMQSIRVVDGQRVAAGQQIGTVGTLGNSTGCHLHFEVRPGGGSPIDPTAWLARHGVYV
jgi:peptidoglycan DL-endopeptidase CwlO